MLETSPGRCPTESCPVLWVCWQPSIDPASANRDICGRALGMAGSAGLFKSSGLAFYLWCPLWCAPYWMDSVAIDAALIGRANADCRAA